MYRNAPQNLYTHSAICGLFTTKTIWKNWVKVYDGKAGMKRPQISETDAVRALKAV